MRRDDGGSGARAPIVVAVVLLMTAVLAACSGSAGGLEEAANGGGLVGDARDSMTGGEAMGETDGAPAPEDGSSHVADDAGPGVVSAVSNAAPIEQRIVRTGEITIEVERVATSLAEVRTLVTRLGGYVGDSQAGTLEQSATLTLRIPADRFAEALTLLRDLGGDVVAEATREVDVTGQIVDLEARIENLRASEESYRALLARAERIDDVLAVQSRLDEVRMQIEQLVAQLEHVTAQADLSTLSVTLIPRPEPVQTQTETWDPGRELGAAVAALLAIGQALLTGVIWFAVVWLPILLVLAVLGLVLLRGVIELRRRVPAG